MRGRSILLVIAVAMAASLAASGCGGKVPGVGGAGGKAPAGSAAAYEEAMAEAGAAMKTRDYDKAVAGYERALAIRPGDADARLGLDVAEQARDKVKKGEAVFSYARQVSPQLKRLAALNPTFEQFSQSGEVADLRAKQQEVVEIRAKVGDIGSGLEPDLGQLNDRLINAVETYDSGLSAIGRGGSAGDLRLSGVIKRDYAAARNELRRFAADLLEYAARYDVDVTQVEKLVSTD